MFMFHLSNLIILNLYYGSPLSVSQDLLPHIQKKVNRYLSRHYLISSITHDPLVSHSYIRVFLLLLSLKYLGGDAFKNS